MASFYSNVFRTCGIIIYLIITVCAVHENSTGPWIKSMKVLRKNCDMKNCKYYIRVRGGVTLGHFSWRLTPEQGVRGGVCDVIHSDFELKEVKEESPAVHLEIILPNLNENIFFCSFIDGENGLFGGKWVHQGAEYYLNPKNDFYEFIYGELSPTSTTTQAPISTSSESDWQDLKHDLDVNYLLDLPKLSMEERNDIEVKKNEKYVPLNYLSTKKPVNEGFDDILNIFNNMSNSIARYKRDDLDYSKTEQSDKMINRKYLSHSNINIGDVVINEDNLISESEKSNNDESHLSDTLLVNVPDDRLLYVFKVESNTDRTSIYKYNETMSVLAPVKDKLNNLEDNVNVGENFKVGVLPIRINNNTEFKNSTSNPVRYNFKNFRSKHLRNISDKLLEKHITESVTSSDTINTSLTKEKKWSINKFGDKSKDEKEHNDKTKNHNDIILISKLDKLSRISNERSESIINSEKEVIQHNLRNENLKNEIEAVGPEAKPNVINLNDQTRNERLNDIVDAKELQGQALVRKPREVDLDVFTTVHSQTAVPNIEGIRVEDSEKDPKVVEGGIPSVLADSGVTLRIFGDKITSRTVIALTHEDQQYGLPCKFLLKGEYGIKEGSLTHRTALIDITVPPPLTGSKIYLCAKNLKQTTSTPSLDEGKYIHQGNETYKMFASHNSLLPLWFSLLLILVCLSFSALFSGLNLGLMSLDKTELKIISNTGTEQERRYAKAIMPVRDHGNYLLCSILLGNVAVNSTFTILLDELTSGLFAVIVSTLAIVLLGEITPQAICSRHGLMIGAKSIMVTKTVMALTAPLAFPISKLLDYFLGEEIGNVYNRERLKELVKVTTGVNDLDKDEVNIISGALELRKKTVSDVMTKLEDVFMLPISSVLDFETMSEIVKSGYSRIPVYEGNRGNIVTVLFIKDLAFVDPDDNTPLQTLCQYYQNPCNFVFEDVTLDIMFKQFKEGHKGHMAFVHRINNEGEGDPFYETIGLVTLEDVIEEMIQAEIIDETDVFMDNRSKRRRKRPQHKLQDFAAFAERHENQRIHISPQLTLATFQFLSTSVDAFRPDTVSETVLRRLLRQDVIQYIKVKGKAKRDPSTFVFQQGKPVDYFVLILEGRVEVTVGRENLVFEAGPFTYFGIQALTQNVGVAESPTPSAMGSLQNINMDSMLRHTFVPDYSVRAISELYYLTVKRSLYLAAKRATLMEKGALSKGATNDQFDTEVDKLLQSVDEDVSITGEHKTPSRQVSPNPPPPPVSATSHTRSSFASRASPERNGDLYATAKTEEQEKLLK